MKMTTQRFCLRWNNHQSNLLSVFDQLLHAETFTDVTLAVDGQYLRAHKMVLSACSPYFNALFINHPERHPIVILKDVPYADMKSLLDFMYRGEVSVDQERLTAFLRVAESLRIKGLTEVNDEKPSSNEGNTAQPPQLQRIQPYLVQQRNKGAFNSNAYLQRNQGQTQQQALLNSSTASMPKRKRGRPRKLSGSSNGTGEYDEFDRDEMTNDDMGDRKLNDSFSGHDDASDDYQRDSDDHNENSPSQTKKLRDQKEMQIQFNDNDNSTSELSRFHCGKPKGATENSTPEQQRPLQQQKSQQQNAAFAEKSMSSNNQTIPLPAGTGLRISNVHELNKRHANILLQHQLLIGKRQTIDMENSQTAYLRSNEYAQNNLSFTVLETKTPSNYEPENNNSNNQHNYTQITLEDNPAESQEQNLSETLFKVPTTQQGYSYQKDNCMLENKICEETRKNYKSDTTESLELLLVNSKDDLQCEPEITICEKPVKLDCPPKTVTKKFMPNIVTKCVTNRNRNGQIVASVTNQRNGSIPAARRRTRRKAQSTVDDQAEHLTEMSVRGLDLFRYACIKEGVYQCTECAKDNMQKTFKNKYSFQRHAFLYHEGKSRKVFPCNICGKEFSRPDKMKNHLKMTHEMFASKDSEPFNTLNYLITAVAVKDAQSQATYINQRLQQECQNAQKEHNFEKQAIRITVKKPSPSTISKLDENIVKSSSTLPPQVLPFKSIATDQQQSQQQQ